MPVALGNVGSQIFDAVEPTVRNRQIDAQLAIARAQIKAQKQAQLLNLGKDLFNQFNQNYQQDKQLQAQAFRDQQQAQERERDRQNQLAIAQQRLQNAAAQGANKIQLETLKQQIAWEQKVQAAQQQGMVFGDDQLQQQDRFKKAHADIEQNPELNAAQKAMAHQAVAMREFTLIPNKQTLTPEQQFNQSTLQGPDGRLYPKLPNGQIDFQHPLDNKNNAQMDDATSEFYKALATMDNPTHEQREELARNISKSRGVAFKNPIPATSVIKGAATKPAYTPIQVFNEKQKYQSDINRIVTGDDTVGRSLAEKLAIAHEQMAPLRQLIQSEMDPNFMRGPGSSPQAQASRMQLQEWQRDIQSVMTGGTSTPAETVKRLNQFIQGPKPSDPGLATLQQDIIGTNAGNKQSAARLNQFRQTPDVMRSQYAPIQSQTGGFAPPSASFVPQPQQGGAPQQQGPLMIGGQPATPFQQFVAQGGTLDTGSIASNPIGAGYLSEARGNINEALRNFESDRAAFMDSLPTVRNAAEVAALPEGQDIAKGPNGIVLAKSGSVDNFVPATPPRRPKVGGGGPKPGGGPPLPKLSGQGAQKPPSQIGSGRPQDRVNNPATGKGGKKSLDPDNPNPRDGLPSKVLLFVNKDERGQKLRELINKMPAEQRERIQVVDADWNDPDLAKFMGTMIKQGDELPVLIKGEKKADGTYQQIFRNDSYDDILKHMTNERSMRTLALHPDEYEPLDAIDDRHITRERHLNEFDEAARRDPNGDALRGMVDPYREDFPGMRPAERINRDIYRRAYEDYRNAQESGASPEELRALRDKPIKELPEMSLQREMERSDRVTKQNAINRETERVKTADAQRSQPIAAPQSPSTSYTRFDAINDLQGSRTNDAAMQSRRGPTAVETGIAELDRQQRVRDWAENVLSDKTSSKADQQLANAIQAYDVGRLATQREEIGGPRALLTPEKRDRQDAMDQAKSVIDQAIRTQGSTPNKDALADKRVADIQRQNSPEGKAAAEQAQAASRAAELSRLIDLRERIANQVTQARNEIAALNSQKAGGTPLTESQRRDYDTDKEQIKYSEKQLASLDAQIKQLSKEVAKDQAKQKAEGIQAPAAAGQPPQSPPGVPQLQPMSRSAFTEKALQSRVPASNGGTRPPGQQEIRDAYENHVRDVQNENDRRAGRPPSFPTQPPRQPSVGPQSGIQPRGASLGVGPYSERLKPNSQTAAGFPGFQRAQQPSQNPALRTISRAETQQRDAQQRDQQTRAAALQNSMIAPPSGQLPAGFVPNLAPQRQPNPRGTPPRAPFVTDALGKNTIGASIAELARDANDPQFNRPGPDGKIAPYTAGYSLDSPFAGGNRGAQSQGYSILSPDAFGGRDQSFINLGGPGGLGNIQAGTGASGFNFVGGGGGFSPYNNGGYGGGYYDNFNGGLESSYYGGIQSGTGYSEGGQWGGGPEPDFYVPGGYDYQNYDFYQGGGGQGYDYGGGIYGGYS